MTKGLQDNPSRLIITLSPQWRKPDPKHGTARHGQPTAPLINERQLPWLLSFFVCFWKESGHRTFKVFQFLHNRRSTKTMGMSGNVGLEWRHDGKEFKDNFCSIADYFVAQSLDLTYGLIISLEKEVLIKKKTLTWYPDNDFERVTYIFFDGVCVFILGFLCVWQRQYSTEMSGLFEEKVQQRENDRAMQKQRGRGRGFSQRWTLIIRRATIEALRSERSPPLSRNLLLTPTALVKEE